MVLVTGAMARVIFKLGKLLHQQYKLQKGVRKKILSLSRDLESMYAALRKVAEVPPEQLDEQVKLWARDVRELSYDVEDILDTFLLRVEGCKEGKKKWYKRAANEILGVFSKTKARYDISGMMEMINEKANEVAIRHQRYRADDIVAKPAPKNTVDPRLQFMHKEVDQLVGIDMPSSKLISMLSCSNDVPGNKLKIVSVVGFGGLGKTTLVKAVYDKLISDYDCGAFVSVGRNPDLVDVFKKIIYYLSKKEYKNIRKIKIIDLVIGELRNFLRNKRYLIVIDDTWEIESWETINIAFPEDNKGSRIITTTRKAEVAHGEVYNMKPLSDDNSKSLFYTRMFGEDKCPDNDLIEVSNAILNKCGGVPLAIITMASLLLGKSKQKWIEVRDSPGFYRNKDDRHMENTMHILALSYYDLPYHLKSCLLYLSVFPEDYIVDKDCLIWMWVAEGFIERKPEIGLFEVGEGYFYDLVNRSMMQEVDSETYDDMFTYDDHRRTWCSVHDMVLDLILFKSHEESFVSDQGTLSQSRARRFAQKNRTLDLTPQDDSHVDLPQLRSFIACVCDIGKWTCRHQRFQLLRVLALEYCTFKGGDLEHLGNLLHLRYLGLRYTDGICELPDEIEKLKFLQILDLEGSDIKELPSSLGKLTQMVCLRARGIMAPDEIIGKLTSLEELQIDPRDNDESRRQFWKDLGNLRELRILQTATRTREMDESVLADFEQSLGSLQRLIIEGMNYNSDWNDRAWDGAVLPRHLRHLILPKTSFSRLPACINPLCLSSLSHLDVYVDTMDEQAMNILGGLPELCYLRLQTWSTATSILTTNNVAADGYFQKLRSLALPRSMVHFVLNEDSSVSFTICNLLGQRTLGSRMVEGWRGDSRAIMPNLQELEFKIDVESKGLIKNNLGLNYLPSLQKVRVDLYCWTDFVEEVDNQEAAIRREIEAHRNRPMLQHYTKLELPWR